MERKGEKRRGEEGFQEVDHQFSPRFFSVHRGLLTLIPLCSYVGKELIHGKLKV